MADVIKTIGASGADYTTLAAWWSARNTNAGAGDKYIGILIDAADYAGGEFSGTYSGDSIEIRGGVGVALDLANPSAAHCRIVADAANGLYWRCVKPTVVKGVEIYTASTTQINLRLAAFEDTNFTAELCWIRGGSDGVTHQRATGLTTIKNSVVSDTFTWGVSNGFAGVTLENVALVRNNTSNTSFRGGCRKDVAGCTLTNVVAVGNNVSGFFGTATNSTVSYLASSDTTASGSNAITGVTTAAFTNYASNVFTAAAGGVLDNTGPGGSDRGLNLSVADIIAVTSPYDWQFFARNKTTNTGSIAITGTYSGSTVPSSIEARWNGGTWAVVTASPSGGTFSGTLTDLPSGNGTLEVRYSNATTVTDSVGNVGIGAKFLFWGQSNFSGRANNAQAYTGTAGYFHKYTVTNNVWQQGADPFDTDTASGSIFPLLATRLVSDIGCPVAFIGVASGSTSLAQWQSGQTLNTRMLNYISSAASDGLEGICSWIGETDAGNATTETDFKSRYNSVIDQLKTLTGVDSMLVAISGLALTDYANVRQWINDIAATNVNVKDYVPQIWPLYQKIHYETDGETALAATAVGDGIMWSGGGTPPVGVPSITTTPSVYSATVTVTYSSGDNTGFEYQVGSGSVVSIGNVSSFTITGLSPETSYVVRVRAKNDYGVGTWSTDSSFTTTAAPPSSGITIQDKKIALIVSSVLSYPNIGINDAIKAYLSSLYGSSDGISDLIARYLGE